MYIYTYTHTHTRVKGNHLFKKYALLNSFQPTTKQRVE